MSKFHANGKLLLTGEYLVLQGACALALPLKMGQSLEVMPSESDTNLLTWKSFKPDGAWFSVALHKDTLKLKAADDAAKGEKLAAILSALRQLAPQVFEGQDVNVETRLDFDPEWGLGSSSTLVANLSQWAKVNPYELLRMTFGGSGYDVACATAQAPILYQLQGGRPTVREVDFNPSFADSLYFVYQGRKQNSAREIGVFKARMTGADLSKEVAAVSAITSALAQPVAYDDFCRLLREHESILSRCLSREPLQARFPDFDGCIKSLGAWGGDFFLAASRRKSNEVKAYFQAKGLEVVFRYEEIAR